MTAGGRRENGQVISIYVRPHLTIGGKGGELSSAFRGCLAEAFSGSGCRLSWESRMDATAEGFMLLKALGYPIRPAEDEGFFTAGPKRMLWSAIVFVMCKTPLGRLAATDHCAHAVSEMTMLDQAWEELRAQRQDISLPVWDSLRKSMPVEEKQGRHEEIKNAYKSLGGDATFYDGMITCS